LVVNTSGEAVLLGKCGDIIGQRAPVNCYADQARFDKCRLRP
jgi:hypothetical protein